MGTPSMRRTDRVSLTVLLEASGTDSNGQEFKEPTRTLLINRGGAVIILERELKPEQQIQIRRQAGADSQKDRSGQDRGRIWPAKGRTSLWDRDTGP